MNIKVFSDKVLFTKKEDVLRLHLYFKLLEDNIKISEKDMDIILYLHKIGGYNNSKEQTAFIDTVIDKKLRSVQQSVRNMLSAYVKTGVLLREKNSKMKVNPDYLPEISCDKLVLKHIISHAE